jgi:fructose-1,6-bisphosphatase
MFNGLTLAAFLQEEQRLHGLSPNLAGVVEDMARAIKQIAHHVSQGALGDVLGSTDAVNIQGEVQKKLDVEANDIILRCHESSGRVAAMASEEMDSIYLLPIGERRGDYLLVFDPLDGSTNIDINLSIGTIFSILPCPRGVNEPREIDFLQSGRNQICAGYAIYSQATVLVLTLGRGVHSFTLDRQIGEFFLVQRDLHIAPQGHEYAINTSNWRFWEPPIRRYIEECHAGAAGPRGKDFNMRWMGAMVADCHRVLSRGGVFLYPRDLRDPNKPGKLRQLYEANPIALLTEQAGGAASTGRESILDLVPQTLHQRIPVILGAVDEVRLIETYHQAGPLRSV